MFKSKFRLMELFCFVLALLVMRIVLILFPFEHIYADTDELSRGALAKEIMGRPMLPIFDYLDGDAEMYEGGRLVISLVTVPFFKIFGESYFSLKLVAVFFSAITLICWWVFLISFFSVSTARWFALLFLFCPPLYTIASLVSWGAHAEFYFFLPVLFYLFYSIYLQKQSQKEIKLWAAFGLVSGMAVWVGQINVLALAVCWIFLLRQGKEKKDFSTYLIYIVLFISGYAFGIWHFISRHWRRALLSDSIFTHFPGSHPVLWTKKIFLLITQDLVGSFLFPWFWVSYAYYLIFLFAVAVLLRLISIDFFNSRKNKTFFFAPLLLYFFLYLVVYIIGDFSATPETQDPGFLDYYYTITLYPVIFALIAIFSARLKASLARIIKFIILFLSGAGFLGYFSLIPWYGFGATFKEQGYSYFDLGDRLPWGLTKEGLRSLFANLRNLDSHYAPDFLQGIANGVAFNEYIHEDVDSVYALFNSAPDTLRIYLYQGWGNGLNDPFLNDYSKAERILDLVILYTEDKYEEAFYFALGKGIVANAVKIQDIKDVLLLAESKLPETQRRYFYDGIRIGIKQRDPVDYLYLKDLLSPSLGWYKEAYYVN